MTSAENSIVDMALEVEEGIACNRDASPVSKLYKKESNISSLLTQLAACGYDRAKEIADAELEFFKLQNAEKAGESQTPRSSLELSINLILHKIFIQICCYEKSYGNLTFLSGSKSIFKKENPLKTAYNSTYNELVKICSFGGSKSKETPTRRFHSSLPSQHEPFQSQNDTQGMSPRTRKKGVTSSMDDVFSSLQSTPISIANDIMCFIAMRLELIDFYDRLVGFGETSTTVQGTQVTSIAISSYPSDNQAIMKWESTTETSKYDCNTWSHSDGGQMRNKDISRIGHCHFLRTSRCTLANMKNKSIFMPYKVILVPALNKLENTHSAQLNTSCLQNLSSCILWEFGALNGLLKALLSLEAFDYYESLLNINKANSYLTTWESFIKSNREHTTANAQVVGNKSPASMSGGRSLFESFWYRKGNTAQDRSKQNESEKQATAVGSSLFRWLVKLKDVVLSKFTFYYYNELSSQVSPLKAMRIIYDENMSRLSYGIDFLQKLETFQKNVAWKYRSRNILCCFFLICETDTDILLKAKNEINENSNTQAPREPHNVHHILFSSTSMASNEALTIEESKKDKSYLSAISFNVDGIRDGSERNIDLEIISSQLQEETSWANLARPNQVVHFDCNSKDAKYFLLRSEPQIVVAFKISAMGTPRQSTIRQPTFNFHLGDVQEISQFLHEIARDTRCNNVFAALKGASISI